VFYFFLFFFFSSRRRHTRFSRDWSSDVCSSDLDLVGDIVPTEVVAVVVERLERGVGRLVGDDGVVADPVGDPDVEVRGDGGAGRSEERRVGKECRSRWTR